jgi:hypothetical protein
MNQVNGLHVTLEEADAWLAKLEAGKDAEPRKCQVIWTPPALNDVRRLFRSFTLKDPTGARRAVQAIRAELKVLAHQPRVGRPVDDRARSFGNG